MWINVTVFPKDERHQNGEFVFWALPSVLSTALPVLFTVWTTELYNSAKLQSCFSTRFREGVQGGPCLAGHGLRWAWASDCRGAQRKSGPARKPVHAQQQVQHQYPEALRCRRYVYLPGVCILALETIIWHWNSSSILETVQHWKSVYL